MTIRFPRLALLLAVLALAGCGKKTVVEAKRVDPFSKATGPKHKSSKKINTPTKKLDPALLATTDVDVAAWLKLSRPELAKLSDEWTATVKNDQQAARNSPDAVDLLPRLAPPVRLPVFREAVFSAESGLSLPPYLQPGVHDARVALHLARFGDHEAALKLAPPGDTELRKQIDELRCEQNYPVEWSRLVGLVLASSQLKLASGDAASASRLAVVHKQLRDLLDARAAEGPLGEVLLPAGRRALSLATKAWREKARKEDAFANAIDSLLADWGTVPGPKPALLPGATREAIAATFGLTITGKVCNVRKREDMARALDLMDYPIPTEALAVLTVFLDARDRLAEIQFTYRGKIDDVYPEPIHLGYHLEEDGLSAKSPSAETSLYGRSYVGAGLSFEAWRTNRSNALGGWVCIRSAEKPAATPGSHDRRVFGPLHLDRGFESNRLALVPNRSGSSFHITDKATLKRLSEGLTLPIPTAALLQREDGHDLLGDFRLVWSADQTARALEEMLPALWSAFGNAQVAAREDATGACLAFTWQDERTLAQLVLPFDDKEASLTIRDSRGKDALAQRAAAAGQRDQTERKVRLAANKPEVRLPRSPGAVNDFSLEGLRLGQRRSEAEAALPEGKSFRRKDFEGGTSVVMLSEPLKGSVYWAGQIILRYSGDRLAEVRLRYHEGLVPARKGETLLEQLSAGKAGAPESVAASWDGVWAGLPRRGKTVAVRWQDDLTVRTYQRDGSGAEVVLTDRAPADAGKPLAPLAFISAGVPGCQIGDTKEQVRTALKAPAATSGGADVHRLPADSPYEMVLVWYADGKVSRLLAVHRLRPGTQEKEVAAALGQAWGHDVAGLGMVRREEGEHGRVLGSYFWHDDRTRVETFVQNDDQGTRLMTEWRPWTRSETATAGASK
jgi:hypothetical protein